MFELRTKRLVLRDIIETDFASMHKLRSNPEVTRYMEYLKSENEQETRDWLVGTMHHNALVPRQSYNLTIIRQADCQILGWIGIGKASEPSLGDFDFGYAIFPEYWGQGYATEALIAMIDCAFEQLNAKKIYGECDGENVASLRVMEKAGLHRQATDDEVRYVIEK